MATKVPPHDVFTLDLNKVIRAEGCVIEAAKCEFTYHWDFETNMGMAQLLSIDEIPVSIPLHPLGIEGWLDFMSDIETSIPVPVNGNTILIRRVILDINLSTGERSAALILGDACIIGTENFGDDKLSTLES